MKLKNPIIPGYYPDPSCLRVGEEYYVVTSSFEYFPGVPIWHSRDLVNWKQIGYCLTRDSQLPLQNCGDSRGIWAPTLRYHDGRFYMVTSNMHEGGHFYVYTDDIEGEWSEPIWVEGGGWDSSLHFDDDGKVYFTWFEIPNRVFQVEIDIETGKHLTEKRLIWTGTGTRSPEAPHLYHWFGQYYLMVAEGGTEYGHMCTIARSDNPWGPFESCPHNPIISHRSLDNPIQATGHGDIFQAHDGSWWIVFLGIRPVWYPPRYHLGRETFLAPVKWEEGWPVVGLGGFIKPVMEVDGLPLKPWGPEAEEPECVDFNQPLGLFWNYLRNPKSENYSLDERPGFLRLKGAAGTIAEEVSPTFLGRRQRHFQVIAETRVDFEPQVDGEEAGLTSYMNHKHHYEIAVTMEDGVKKLIFRRQIGTLVKIENEVAVKEGPVRLSVDIDKYWYRFSYAQDDEELKSFGKGEVQYLSTEVGGAFTGVYLAMYATGNGKACTVPADFDYFIYHIKPEEFEDEKDSMLDIDDI